MATVQANEGWVAKSQMGYVRGVGGSVLIAKTKDRALERGKLDYQGLTNQSPIKVVKVRFEEID